LNHRLLALALGTFAIGTGSFVFAGLLAVLALDIGSLGSLGWTDALCTLLSLAVLAVGTCAKGPEAAPEG
jgi:predicted MFS family arabinose efflux permease